jgi:diaminopimelate epimerase
MPPWRMAGSAVGLAFTKMHGLGNDFVVLDGVRAAVELDARAVRAIADRRLGVGCDQLLVVVPADEPGADLGYRVFNADGTEVEQCGNGARCVARFIHEAGLAERPDLVLATAGGRVRTRRLDGERVAVDMGVPRFAPAEIPFEADAEEEDYPLAVDDANYRIGAVSMGNPHAVLRVPDTGSAPVGALGPRIEHHPRFPRGANVGFVEIVAPDRVRLRVWERGVGETRACGTGACAAVAVGRRQGLLDGSVRVVLTGGELVIDWPGTDNPLWMTGPAATVFHGTLDG